MYNPEVSSIKLNSIGFTFKKAVNRIAVSVKTMKRDWDFLLENFKITF